ncbi:MAG: hypothetical protein KJ062_05630, partial [Thermoanaerobaculia bacterium]|nr:hypothetical protein [Thermoanaerobaculia bacterium]
MSRRAGTRTLLVVALLGLALPGAAASPAAPLRDELAALRPYVGKTWKALVNAEKKQYDVSRWDAALGGRVVRILHSVADGAYGGESIVRWDPVAKEI